MSPQERRDNYGCDITYVTNSELGFDFLRDNLATVSFFVTGRSMVFQKLLCEYYTYVEAIKYKLLHYREIIVFSKVIV